MLQFWIDQGTLVPCIYEYEHIICSNTQDNVDHHDVEKAIVVYLENGSCNKDGYWETAHNK